MRVRVCARSAHRNSGHVRSTRGRVFQVTVLLALSLADLGASKDATAAGTPTPTPATPPLSAAPTQGQIQSTLPSTPTAPDIKSAPLVNTPAPIVGEVASGGPTITVTGFDITGNTIFSNDLLQQQVASYVGKDLTLAGLYAAANDLTKFYQSHGYGLTRVTLPEQQLNDGHVTLQVIEGKLGKISVESNTRTRSGVIMKQGDAVQSGDIYTDAAMDRASLLVNDLPAVQAQAVLQPGSVFGTTDLIYKVQEDKAYSGQVSVDDYGRADVGRWRLNAEANVASLTGSGDKLTADVTHTESNALDFGALTYSLPLGPAGGRFSASYNQSEYHVGKLFTPLGLSGSSKNATGSYLYPQVRSHTDSFFWGFGIEHESGESTSEPLGQTVNPPEKQVTETNLNLLQLTAFYLHVYDDGASYNLNGTFASNGRHNEGTNASAERARLEVDGSYLQPFDQLWSFIGKAAFEWSPDPLADTEKYSLGGPDSVRGYPSADQRGDVGAFASLEFQRSFAPDLPFSAGVFFDAGRVMSKHFDTPVNPRRVPSGFVITPPESRTISSVGAELIYESSDKRWESRLEWAFAVGDAKPSDGNGGGHIWATFGMNF